MRLFGYSFKGLVPGIVATILAGGAVGGAAFLFVLFGGLNLSASYSDPKPVYWVLHHTFKNSVWWRATEDVPEDLDDPGRIALGAQHYANACAKCHGGPGLGQNPQALAMRPRPQHLPAVVDQFSDGELHYILDSGVRMSAMPAWPTVGREDEIWNVVAFIRQLPEMTADEYVGFLEHQDLPGDPQIPYGERGVVFDNGLDDGPQHERWPEDEYGYFSPSTEWRDFAVEGEVVQRCAACHGADGSGEITGGRAPNLTLLDADYIEDQLRDFASGERRSGIMQVVATNLSSGQREGLANYYDSLPDIAAPAVADADVAMGEQIATEGKLVEGVPACVTCHNGANVEDDRVAGLQIPNLAGQSASYIEAQLRLFANGEREGGATWKPMGYIASNLTEEEMGSLAAWFSTQEPNARLDRRDLLAEADLDAGADVVERICKECHTEQGIGSQSGDTPNLSLQDSHYLHQQLWKFRQDIRPNSQMGQTAKQISPEEIANVAAYFGNQMPIAVARDVDAQLVSAGQSIARNGIPESDVPACLTCHGAEPTETLNILPRLLGQNRVYIEERLDQFAGQSGVDTYGLSPMHRIATRMTEEQRAEVAAWFSAQDPLAKN